MLEVLRNQVATASSQALKDLEEILELEDDRSFEQHKEKKLGRKKKEEESTNKFNRKIDEFFAK